MFYKTLLAFGYSRYNLENVESQLLCLLARLSQLVRSELSHK